MGDQMTLPPIEISPGVEILGVARYQLRELSPGAPQTERPLFFESEQQIIRHILEQPKIFRWFFEFMMAAALGLRPRGRDVVALCSVPRRDVGLNPMLKPGDFDVVLLPTSDGKYFLQQIMAIEVKILRLPVANRDKHIRPSGTTQARGLVRDGFPYVGMLHVIVAEPSPKAQWKSLVHARIVNDNLEAEIIPGPIPTDMVGIEIAERQFGRMRRYVDGTSIGAKAVSLVLDESGRSIVGRDLSQNEITPTRNPYTNTDLLKKLCNIAHAIERRPRKHHRS